MNVEALERKLPLDLICKEIFCISDHIDLVAILNQKGRVEDMMARDDGVNRDLTAHKREMLFMECVLQASMHGEYDDEFGKVKGLIIQREKVLALTFQIDNYFLLAITKPVLNPTALQQKIAAIIFKFVGLAN